MSPSLRNQLMTSTALLALGAALGVTLLALGAAPSGAQPTGGNVVGGTATITGAGTNSVIVNQATDRAIINWNTFNIATGGAATFNQPGTSSITLNRVTGGLGPSVIDGTLTANGRVFVINRDGMLFGRNAVINTAGFLATTNDIRNNDFMAGRNNFNIAGRADASIVNFGTITASSGGFAALVAPGVRNTGTISARLGTVSLASGNSFTLDMYGDKLIQIAVGDEIASKVIDVSTGKPLNALVSNEGTLRANGGRVEITAAAARHMVDSVINNTGVIEANSVGTRGGMIVLGGATEASKAADLPKQTVRVSGQISATGNESGARGGIIKITGEDIRFAAAMLDVSGHTGGGTILAGGDYGGGRPIPGGVSNQSAVLQREAIPTATTLTVDAASSFNASATANGHGGKVILWSNAQTNFGGTIFARGGEFGGNGGFVEVSGQQGLAFTGAVDTLAPHGQTGTLLLDPANFYIDRIDGPARPQDATVMTNVQVQNLLAATNVTIATSAASNPEGQYGDIFVNAPINWSNANSLTLSAHRNILVDRDITNTGGADVVLRADNTGSGIGTVNLGESTISTAGKVSIFYNPTSYTDAATKSDRSSNPYGSSIAGGADLTAYMLVNSVSNLQAVGTNLAGTYALGRDINANNAALARIGVNFTGVFDGQGHTISNATIAGQLFSTIDALGKIRNVDFTNIGITVTTPVSTDVGIIAGRNFGTIDNVSVGGTINLSIAAATGGLNLPVHKSVRVGGLVGGNFGTITDSDSAVAINVSGSLGTGTLGLGVFQIGGIAGTNSGAITDSQASGAINFINAGPNDISYVGGLVGQNSGLISFSNATGAISAAGSSLIGGLVGNNANLTNLEQTGVIINSYATGPVTGTGSSANASAGGLVGTNAGNISNSHAGGNVVANSMAPVGGLVGHNLAGATITDAQALGNATSTFNAKDPTQSASAGGLVGINAGTITSTTIPLFASSSCAAGAAFSCATGNVNVGVRGNGGGLVGQNNGTINRSFAIGNVNGASGLDEENATHLGGLAGSNSGTITNSFARGGTVGGTDRNYIVAGGLVGDNAGLISNSTASGNVLVGDYSLAGGLAGNNAPSDVQVTGNGANNSATILNSAASGAVSVGAYSIGGGFVGGTTGTIDNSSAAGPVTGRAVSGVGGFAGGNGGTIHNSNATGNVTTDQGFAGGFIGFNFGAITLSYAKGNVTSTGAAFVGGFVGLNSGTINQAYAAGTATGGAGSLVGGFVGLNVAADIGFADAAAARASASAPQQPGAISQSYALGPVTGNNAMVAAGFAALNLGALEQVYAVGRVQGGNGAILGGLVGSNTQSITLPDFGQPTTFTAPNGTATNSYWDMQTTGVTTSAGGAGMNTAVLAGGLPPGFDPAIWSNGSYPFLVNLPLPQDTQPRPPVIPPVGESQQFLQPPDQQINANTFGPSSSQGEVVPDAAQVAQQQQQQAQQQADQTVTGSTNQDPIRLDVGENRYFYLPPPGETRLVENEVVLQMPCDLPEATLSEIVKQHGLTVVSSQCLQAAGIAAYRMRHASSETISSVIRALASRQIIAAAQANYLFAMQQQEVQSATSQQGDPGQYVPAKLRLHLAHRVVTGRGVPIGVIDSEIDGAHPDYAGAVVDRYDATGMDDNPHPHGTGMAGAIVSRQRLLGVAPGARIFAVRTFSSRAANSESTTFHILKGLDWAVGNQVRIINMSFAGPRDPSLERALKAANDQGVVLIAAAGNAGPRAPAFYPAADPSVIAVTATDIEDRLFSGANRGAHVAIAAPGVDILVPAPAGEYQVTTGTSVATAHISGVVALMLERNPRLTPAEIRKILTASAKRIGPSNMFGAGLVDPVRAIEMATPRSAQAPAPVQPPVAQPARAAATLSPMGR
jgi:filamentous hemagglutinin family protein